MDESKMFSILNDEGVEVLCEILFTFRNEETGRNYLVYTDNTLDESGNTKVYASVFYPEQGESRLDPIETEEEWAMIGQILEQLQQDVQEGRDIPEEMDWPPAEGENILPFERPDQ